MKQETLTLCEYFIRLVRYGADGARQETERAPEKPDGVKWEEVFALAEKHSLSTLCYAAISNCAQKPDGELFKRFEKAYRIGIHADVQQLFAWEEIKEKLTAAGLKILPLKGLHVKKLYPQTAFRQMGDLDILYERKDFPKVKEIMEDAGFSFVARSIHSNHQIFSRPPVLEVEMHSHLMPEGMAYRAYYDDPWKRAVETDEAGVYRFNRNDEYIYSVLHAAKHYATLGSGIRTVADFYLYNKQYGAELDREYIERELQAADEIALQAGYDGVLSVDFEKTLRRVADAWFQAEEIAIDEEGLRMLSDGVYGKMENRWERESEKKGKKKYLFERLFPPYSVMKLRNPCLKKFPFLLPFCWIGRLFTGLKKRDTVMREYRYVQEKDKRKK